MAQSRQTRRGASRSPRKKPSRRQVPGWVWLFTGVVVGLFVAFLVHLGGVQMAQPAVATQPQNGPQDTSSKQNAKSGKGDQPKFDFYAVLPKMEVIVPKGDDNDQDDTHPAKPHDNDNPPSKAASSAAPKATSPAPAATATPASGQRYMLQAGSFRHEADADRRRAKLTLRGFQVNIQPVQLDSGDTWHRVMIGPYTTLAALHDAQDKLIKQGVETLPIQIKE